VNVELKLESCLNAWIRASTTSPNGQASRRAQSRSKYLSKTDITKTNRGRRGANRVRALRAERLCDSISNPHQESAFPSLSAAPENTRRMALLIKQRLLQERSHPLKTQFGLTQSSTVARKHRSASVWLLVNRNASRYKDFISLARCSQISAHVAYPVRGCAFCLGRNLDMINFTITRHISAFWRPTARLLLWCSLRVGRPFFPNAATKLRRHNYHGSQRRARDLLERLRHYLKNSVGRTVIICS
jgi:hypothetical protein